MEKLLDDEKKVLPWKNNQSSNSKGLTALQVKKMAFGQLHLDNYIWTITYFFSQRKMHD